MRDALTGFEFRKKQSKVTLIGYVCKHSTLAKEFIATATSVPVQRRQFATYYRSNLASKACSDSGACCPLCLLQPRRSFFGKSRGRCGYSKSKQSHGDYRSTFLWACVLKKTKGEKMISKSAP